MSDLKDLRCFNPRTGKRDGGWCVWEGGGKCMKCEAADEIDRLSAALDKAIADCEVTDHPAGQESSVDSVG